MREVIGIALVLVSLIGYSQTHLEEGLTAADSSRISKSEVDRMIGNVLPEKSNTFLYKNVKYETDVVLSLKTPFKSFYFSDSISGKVIYTEIYWYNSKERLKSDAVILHCLTNCVEGGSICMRSKNFQNRIIFRYYNTIWVIDEKDEDVLKRVLFNLFEKMNRNGIEIIFDGATGWWNSKK